MSNTKHTPTPWRASHGTGPTMQGYSQSSCVAGTGVRGLQIIAGCFNDIGGDEVAAANAAFIIRACNSHDRLVAALCEAIEIIQAIDQTDNTCDARVDVSEFLDALAAAEAA